MYLIVSSSKDISSVVLARLIDVAQPTAWRMGHAIRQMMDSERSDAGMPQPRPGMVRKRGKGSDKQCVLIVAERQDPVRAVLIENEKMATLQPIIDQHVDKRSHLMSDGHRSYLHIGQQFLSHQHVILSLREYGRGKAHCNTAESFSSLFERAHIEVFHFLSKRHL